MKTVNLAEKFARFAEPWSPKIVGELNGQYVKLARFAGDFVWHHHEAEDELFYVVKGEIVVQLEDRELRVREGEFTIIPRGVKHRPVAKREALVLLFEPRATVNTGESRGERTTEDEWI